MIHVYPWCELCQNVAVTKQGDMCVRCIGAFELDALGTLGSPVPRPTPRPTLRSRLASWRDMLRHDSTA